MSVVHAVTGLDYLEQGLKNLKGSKMMAVREFKDMFSAMECHYRDFRLSHLTGKTNDLMEKAEQDTQFYNILVKMLCEIRQDRVHQRAGLSKVYDWYMSNKHVLHSGPHFGKRFHKKESQDIMNVSPRTPRQISTVYHIHAQKQNELLSPSSKGLTNDTIIDSDMVSDFSDTEIDIEFKSAKDDVDFDTSRMDSQMLGSEYKASSVKTTSAVHSDCDWKGRKMVHSVASLVNPHANPALTIDPAQDPSLMSPGQQNTVKRPASKMRKSQKGVMQACVRTTPLQIQDVGVRSISVCGDRLSNSFNVNGVFCQDCQTVKHAKMAKTGIEFVNSQKSIENLTEPQQGKQLHEQSLEEFYQTTEILYPFTTSKQRASGRTYSAKCSRKAKSAPLYRGNVTPDHARQLTRQSEDANRLGRPQQNTKTADKNVKTNIKMDLLVSMIDSVSHEMVVHRDLWSRNVSPCLMQPASQQTTNSSPQARTNTPDSDVENQQPMISDEAGQQLEAHVEPHSDTVAWRASSDRTTESTPPCTTPAPARHQHSLVVRDTPGGNKFRRSKPRFGKLGYSRNIQQSLRSAGGTQTLMQRPRTAPVFQHAKFDKKSNKSPNVSSRDTPIDHESLESAIHVKHLMGTSKDESDMDYEFDADFLRAMRNLSRSVASSQPTLEYVCFVSPTQGNKASGRPDDSTKTQEHTDGLHELIPKVSSVDLVDSLSSRADNLDQQDLGDLEDELKDLCEEGYDQGNDKVTENLSSEEVKKQLGYKHGNTFDVSEDPAIELSTLPAECGPPSREWAFLPNKAGDGILGVLPEYDNEPDDADCNYECHQVNKSSNYAADDPEAMSAVVRPPCSSEKWKFSSNKKDKFKSRTVLKNVLTTSKPPVDLSPAEVRYHRILKLRPNLSRLRSQSARVGGALGRPTSHPDDLFLDFTPKATRIERAAGRVPGSIPSSTAAQVLRMTRKQNEYFRRAPPMRTPPSIPSPHCQLFGRGSPRVDTLFNPELEHHARKEVRPLKYIQHVQDLCRSEGPRSAPPRLPRYDTQLSPSLQICRLPSRGRTLTDTPSPLPDQELTPDFRIQMGSSLLEEILDGDSLIGGQGDAADTQQYRASPVKDGSRLDARPHSPGGPSRCPGRPIAQYQHVSHPEEYAKAVDTQRKAAAAVDIQRIFRGYIARGQYKKLLSEERRRLEDEKRAAVEIQRAYREHVRRKAAIEQRGFDPDLVAWSRDYKSLRDDKELERKEKLDDVAQKNAYNYLSAASKISVIGPHVDVYSIWHPKVTGPTKRELHLIAVVIQRHVRGWLVRKTLDKLKRKAVWNGSTFSKMVTEYKSMLVRVQKQHGKDRIQTPFSFKDFDNYMDLRRRYEGVFERKAFGGELDLSELEDFFHESDLHPSTAEIDEAIDVVFCGRGVAKGRGLKKKEVLDIVFYIYVPKATDLHNTRISTWMNPIIDGVEARKLLGSELVEPAPLSVCMQLVVDSKRERREKEAETERKKKEEEKAAAAANESSTKESTKESSSQTQPTQNVTLSKPEKSLLKVQGDSKEQKDSTEQISKEKKDSKAQEASSKVNDKPKQVKIADDSMVHNIPS